MSLNDFEFGKELGKGAFGSVTIVRRKEDNKIYAMKRVKIGRLSQKEKNNSFNEVRLLASLDHKNIIGYKEAFFDDKSKTLNIVMEYADGGDLSTKIKEVRKKYTYFEEEKIWSTLIQILEGLKYLHQSCIIHRDLKSANIFLTKDGCVKIGDLNVSKILKRMGTASTQTGTPYFASPEIWNDQPYDYKCDIWSVGCIIYEMASLTVPFRGTSMQNLYQNVLRGIYQQIPLRYSDDLRKIIKQILVVNPKNRPSSSELLENKIIKQKMIELGLSKDVKKQNQEKARLMKTIKIPINMSQINMELPQKKYEKEKMLLNDEYETAKRTFYHPPNINNDVNTKINNYNGIEHEIDRNNNNIISKDNNNNNQMSDNKIMDDKNFVDKLLEKDLNKIQNITKNLDNDKYLNNNYINIYDNNNNNINPVNPEQKVLKNIDNNQEVNKNRNSLIVSKIGGSLPASDVKLVEHDMQSPQPYNVKIADNIYLNNKYSNINYDYILNEKDNINRIIKTDMNQINQNKNNNITNTPLSKKEDIIKTEISGINNNLKNKIESPSKESKNILIFDEKDLNTNLNVQKIFKSDEDNENGNGNGNDNNKDIEKDKKNIGIKNDKQGNNNSEKNDAEFKEKYYKLMEEINQKAKLINNENKYNYNYNYNYNNYFNEKNKSVEKKIRNEDIDEEILKSKKELEEIDKSLNLLIKNNEKNKKKLKYNKSENYLSPSLDINNYKNKFRDIRDIKDSKNNVSALNEIKNKNNDYSKNMNVNLYRQRQVKKINNRNSDNNFKNIRNNRQYNNKNNISLRPNFNSNLNIDYSSTKEKSNIVNYKSNSNLNNQNIKKLGNYYVNNPSFNVNKGSQASNPKNNGNSNRNYSNNKNNIFVNYKNNNSNNNYHYRNNYYFNNCNFINNNENSNLNDYNYHYKYNKNYPRNYSNYNEYYKEYFNNFMNYLLKKQKDESNNYYNNKYDYNTKSDKNISHNHNLARNPTDPYLQPKQEPYLINNNNSNKIKLENNIEENNKRKVIYEKINFQKQGHKYKYYKGPAQVRYVGNGNYYNQCHKAIIRNPVILNPSNQFGIQNLRLSGGKMNRNGPRIILPNKMFE